MSEYDLLESTLIQILGAIKPSRDDCAVRHGIIDQFQAVVQPIESLREDPFEQPGNAARAVSTRKVAKISEAFKQTHRRLASPIQNQSSIADTLAVPKIAQQILRRPNGNHTEFTGAYRVPNINQATVPAPFKIHSHAHRDVLSTSQVQYWSHNTRPAARYLNNVISQEPEKKIAIRNPAQGHSPNLQAQHPSHSARPEQRLKKVSSQKPLHTVPSKTQQVWMPKFDS